MQSTSALESTKRKADARADARAWARNASSRIKPYSAAGARSFTASFFAAPSRHTVSVTESPGL
jgi:hypothetical protein